jgi:pimeloyl-ACP methyl ester carboxylesterase
MAVKIAATRLRSKCAGAVARGRTRNLEGHGALDYRKTLPNLKVYYFPHAGHYIQFEQPSR